MVKNAASTPQQHSFADFYLCASGYAVCEPGAQLVLPVRPYYVLYFVRSGRGICMRGTQRLTARTGSGFVIAPGTQAVCQADPEESWTCLWVGFAGVRSAEYLTKLGLGPGSEHPAFQSPDGDTLEQLAREMMRRNTAGVENDFARQGLLYQFFACLARSLSLPAGAVSKDERESLYVQRAAEYVQYNYGSHITVSDMAKYVSLSRSYLFTLFQRVLGVSPQEFLTTFRITRAKEQLTRTDATVAVIASSVGYRDPLVFSKAFKQMTGMTPVQYRGAMRARAGQAVDAVPPLLSRSGYPYPGVLPLEAGGSGKENK